MPFTRCYSLPNALVLLEENMEVMSKSRPAMLLHNGMDVNIIEEIVFIPSAKTSSRLDTVGDERNRAWEMREYIPNTTTTYALYWELVVGLKLDTNGCWALARVKDNAEERIVPIDILCR
jgi:hypothetical protein